MHLKYWQLPDFSLSSILSCGMTLMECRPERRITQMVKEDHDWNEEILAIIVGSQKGKGE
jgi:hypothetical protein